MKPNFQAVTTADEPFLLELYASVRAAEMAIVPWTGEQKRAFLEAQFRAQQTYYAEKYPRGAFQTIRLGDEKIGRLYLAELADETRIIDLTLAPAFRGRGIGSRIVAGILRESSKPVRIYLESFSAAAGLFARLGFGVVRDEGLYRLWENKGVGEETARRASSAISK